MKKRKKYSLKPRFFTIILTLLILFFIVRFFITQTHATIPNLHGWYVTDVLSFAESHDNLSVEFEFIYTDKVAPTQVINQSLPPGTPIEGLESTLNIQISKGIEVR